MALPVLFYPSYNIDLQLQQVCSSDSVHVYILWGHRHNNMPCSNLPPLLLCLGPQMAITEDFQALRTRVESLGLFQAQPLFFCLQLGQSLLLEVLAWMTVWFWGTSWTSTLLCSVLLTISQVTGEGFGIMNE